MLKILAFGDIMGKIGRRALIKKLPALQKKYNPDLVIANGENLAHGFGMTAKTLRTLLEKGVDFFTSGNHIFNKTEEFKKILEYEGLRDKIIRPANYKKTYRKPGEGYKIIKAAGKRILIINILGTAFMKKEAQKVKLPIPAALNILKEHKRKKIDAILLDMHAEATSEKRAMGWALDGKVSVVWGTHTHIPTADANILPQGTGYITDLGMVGARDSIIGNSKEEIIKSMQKPKSRLKHNIPETGPAVIQGIYLEIKNKKCLKIKQILEETVIL